MHCGPGGIFVSALGGPNGDDGPGGVALLDHQTFDVTGPFELDRGEQHFAYDIWWHLRQDTAVSSEWATPSMFDEQHHRTGRFVAGTVGVALLGAGVLVAIG